MSENKIIYKALSIIDDYIYLNHNEIARKIYGETTYCDQDFNKFFSVISDGSITLKDYIRKRRLFFAASDLISNSSKSLAEIAQDYGYSDQSTFSRAIKSEYGQTPAELRRSKPNIPDNRKIVEGYLYKNTRLDAVLNKMISDSYMSNEDWNYFDDFIHATDEYGFDVSTCCIISELSERLNIPFSYLINKCVDIMIDYQSESDNIPPRIEYAIDLGIKSDEELEALCEYYNCKYYELKEWQVLEYRENNQNDRR